jgi:hypothetical protein
MPNRARVIARISDAFIDRLVAKVTEGFRGDVGVVPRQFLRELISVMDLVDEHEDFHPEKAYGFSMAKLDALSPEEQAALEGRATAVATCRHRRARAPDPPASPEPRDPPGGARTDLRLGGAATASARSRVRGANRPRSSVVLSR